MERLTLSKNQERSILVAILLLSLILNLTGITWGLPNTDHFVSYEADELAFLTALRNMDPARLDLNPDNFRIGGGEPLLLAIGIAIAAVLGQVEISGSSEYYFTHIDQWARIYLVGRLLSVICATLSVGMIYLILRELLGKSKLAAPGALLGAFLVAVMPGMVQCAHFLSYNAPGVFWTSLAFYFMLRAMRNGHTRFYVLGGLAIGTGVAVRHTVALAVPCSGSLTGARGCAGAA
jgi:hypothetical protein